MINLITRLMDPFWMIPEGLVLFPRVVYGEKRGGGGEVSHSGDPLLAFTNDHTDSKGWPASFYLQDGEDSGKDRCVEDVDAVYFTRKVTIFRNDKQVFTFQGKGAIKFSDPFDIVTQYQEGELVVCYDVPWLGIGALLGGSKEPHLVKLSDPTHSSYNPQREIVDPRCKSD